jgi:hypothetical protein
MWEERDVAGAIDDLNRRGFTEHFMVVGSELRALESGRTFRPQELIIRDYHRSEGVSDPSDMAIVYALESRDGTLGTLVDAFGVYSSPTVGAFLKDVLIHRTAEERGPPWSVHAPLGFLYRLSEKGNRHAQNEA